MGVDAKICGLTRPEDAALAAELGAWRLGLIFAGGPRLVGVAQAREIVEAARGVPVLGVFGEQELDEILAISDQANLAGVQIHRPTSGVETAAIQRAGLEVWRVFFASEGSVDTPKLLDEAAGADVLLIEPRHPEGGGGHGIPLSLEVARRARAALLGYRVALAGGLTPESVAAAIKVVGPDVVDVSSGVEEMPGIKNRDRLARFLENVRDAGTPT